MSETEALETHLQELRRGTVVLACLRLLHVPGYGYGLLEELSTRGFETDANTLYPLLRRLEKQGHLTSEWNTEDARPRKFLTARVRRERALPQPSPPTSTRSPRRSMTFRRTDMNDTDLIDRYVYAATRSVPERQRRDVADELRASIRDQIDDRAASGEDLRTAERAVLLELGDPDKLAAGFSDRPAYLIGPRYYFEWWRLLKLLLWSSCRSPPSVSRSGRC